MHVQSGASVTFDLIVWPVDRALTLEEARAEVGRLGGYLSFGRGHDRRLDPFIAAMEKRYPGLRGGGALPPPFEFDVHRRQIVMGIPWTMVESVVPDVADVAWTTGLAVYDPQRQVVGLPPSFADAPMTSDGLEQHARAAAEALTSVEGASSPGSAGAPAGGLGVMAKARRAITGQPSTAGLRQVSPLGYEVTPEVEAEFQADPLRMPSSLQTPELKRQLIADMTSTSPGARHAALGQLAGWDPDPEVATALRAVLVSEDVFEAGLAAGGLARQGDITDLPGVLDLVHRMSPADGGSAEAMLLPLRAALELAALGGPMAVDGVRARARTWRGEPQARRQSWEREFDRELDELLGDE
jgi:hypothetical protein